MKKYLLIILSIIFICVLELVGCNNKSLNYIISNEPNIAGSIKEVNENSLLFLFYTQHLKLKTES